MIEEDEFQGARRRLRDALRLLEGKTRREDCDYETRAIVDLALGGWTVLWRYSDDELEEVIGIEAGRDSTVTVYPCAAKERRP